MPQHPDAGLPAEDRPVSGDPADVDTPAPSPAPPAAKVARSTTVDSALLFLISVGSLGTSSIGALIAARYLQPSGKGLVAIVTLSATQVAMMLTLGLPIALVHFGGRGRASAPDLHRVAMRMAVALGVTGGALAFALAAALLDGQVDLRVVAAATFLAVLGQLVNIFASSVLRGALGRMIESSSLNLVAAAAGLVATIVGVIRRYDAEYFVAIVALPAVVNAAGTLLLSRRFGVTRGGRPIPVGPLVRYGLKNHVGTVLQGVNYRLDGFLVALFLSSAAVGNYSVSVQAAEIMWLVPNVLGSVLLQRAAAHDAAHVNRLTAISTRLTSGVLLLASLVLVFTARPLITFAFGPRYEPAAGALLLLLPGIWALGIWKAQMSDLGGRGHPEVMSQTAAAAVAVTIVLDVVLIPRHGIAGAAAATSVAYLTATALGLRRFARITGVGVGESLAPRWSDVRLLVDRGRAMLGRRRRTPAG